MDISALQFPIGKWSPKGEYTPEEFQERLNILKNIPAEYRALTENLSHEDLQKQYREGSWTIQQLINHVADMHLLHYIRFKHALTETDPMVWWPKLMLGQLWRRQKRHLSHFLYK
jgi:exoribonuclease II